MDTFEIIGQIDTVALKISYGDNWKGVCLTPPFEVRAASKQDALKMAENIIDPLHLCTMHLSAELVPPFVSSRRAEAVMKQLGDELDNIVDALNGDSNDDEHDALYSAASVIAGLLNVDLDEMLGGNES